MRSGMNWLLVFAALFSFIAMALHLLCIVFGAEWYLIMGAGQGIADLANAGHWYPAVVTSFISLVLCVWGMYALSAANIIFRLPMRKLALVAISLVLIARAVFYSYLTPYFPGNSETFWYVSSSACLMLGLLFGFGAWRAWPALGARAANKP